MPDPLFPNETIDGVLVIRLRGARYHGWTEMSWADQEPAVWRAEVAEVVARLPGRPWVALNFADVDILTTERLSRLLVLIRDVRARGGDAVVFGLQGEVAEVFALIAPGVKGNALLPRVPTLADALARLSAARASAE